MSLGIGVMMVQCMATPASAQLVPDAIPLAAVSAATPDPWQAFNRRMYAVNGRLDDSIFAPITHAYMSAAPPPLRKALGAAVDNMREPRTTMNDLLQAHPGLAAQSTGRFLINSTLGVLGLFDVASASGLPVHRADFGQTLGRYGIGSGNYIVAPVLGPLDLRDGLGRLVDAVTDPLSLVAGGWTTPFGASRLAASALDYRADADAQIKALGRDATDPYATVRSAYGQRRAYLVGQAKGDEPDLPDFDAPPAAP